MKKILIMFFLIGILIIQGIAQAEYTFDEKSYKLLKMAEEVARNNGGIVCSYSTNILKNNNIFITLMPYDDENAHCKWDERIQFKGYRPEIITWPKNHSWVSMLFIPETNADIKNKNIYNAASNKTIDNLSTEESVDLETLTIEVGKRNGGTACEYDINILKNNNIFINRSFYAENAHCKWDERFKFHGLPLSFWDGEIKTGEWVGTILVPE